MKAIVSISLSLASIAATLFALALGGPNQLSVESEAKAHALAAQDEGPVQASAGKAAPLAPAIEPNVEPKIDTSSIEFAALKKAVEAFSEKTEAFAKSIAELRKEHEALKQPAPGEPKQEKQWLSYSDAHASAKQGGPLVILLGAVWCTGCQELKAELEADFAPNAHYCYIDIDEDTQTARQVMGSKTIPQVVVYEKIGGDESNDWKCDRYNGIESLKAIKARICRGPNAIAVSAAAGSPCANPDCTCDPCTCENDGVTTAYTYATVTAAPGESLLVYRAAPVRTYLANHQPLRTGLRVTARVLTAPVRFVRNRCCQ